MPIYDYKCRQCGQLCEVFLRSQDERPVKCPNCGGESLERLVSAFSVLGSETSEGSTCCGRETLPAIPLPALQMTSAEGGKNGAQHGA